MWGLTPIYWKLVQHVSSEEILAQRFFWSFIFMWAVNSWKNIRSQPWIIDYAPYQHIIGCNPTKRTIKQTTNHLIFISRNWCIHLNVSLRRGPLAVA